MQYVNTDFSGSYIRKRKEQIKNNTEEERYEVKAINMLKKRKRKEENQQKSSEL